jgi:uncharacterized membrane protein YfcA
MLVGGSIGAQAGQKMRAERLRLLLGILILCVGIRFAIALVLPPHDPYEVHEIEVSLP